jgi:hypothetical protein
VNGAGQAGGSPDAEHEDWSAAQPDAHHEPDIYGSYQEPGPVHEAAAIDDQGYTTTEEMITGNETAEDLPYI